VTWRIAMILVCLVLGACAASAPQKPRLAISYNWEASSPLPTFDNQPPAEISIRFEPGTISRKALEQLEAEQCLAWNRQVSLIEARQEIVRFRCDKPLASSSAAR